MRTVFDNRNGCGSSPISTVNELMSEAEYEDVRKVAEGIENIKHISEYMPQLYRLNNALNDLLLLGGGALPSRVVIDTIADLQAAKIPVVSQTVLIGGYYASGDGGFATYKRVAAPSVVKPWHQMSADGAWWQLTGDEIDVRVFGAIGGPKDAAVSTLPNDYAALQAALDYVGLTGGRFKGPGHLQFRTNTGLIARITRQLPVAVEGVGIHFAPNSSIELVSSGRMVIVAGAAMESLITFQYNAALSNIGPFKSKIEGFELRGNGLAKFGVNSDYTMHMTIERNGIDGVIAACINFTGYGVARINYNVLRGPICVRFQGGGGDSILFANDYFPGVNGKCIYLGNLGGNVVINGGTMNGEGNTGCIGVDVSIDGGTDAEVRHVKVRDIEFSGMLYGMRGLAAVGSNKIYALDMTGCHTTPSAGGAVNTGILAHMTRVRKFTASNNRGNGVPGSLATENAFLLFDCDNFKITDNEIESYYRSAAYFNHCTNGQFCRNTVRDAATVSADTPIIDLDGVTDSSRFNDNTFIQTGPAYGQLGLYEHAGATANEALRNKWQGVATPGTLAPGSTSVFRRYGTVFAEGTAFQNATTASATGAKNLTVSRSSLGRCLVSFASAHPDTNYTPKVLGLGCKVELEGKTANGFTILMLDLADNPIDAGFEVEVTSRAP